jgi:PAS domain S-box-containing protein
MSESRTSRSEPLAVGTPEVPVLALWWLAPEFERRGVAFDTLLDGLPVDRLALRNPLRHVPLSVVVAIGQRLEAALGGGPAALDAIESMLASLLDHERFRWLRSMRYLATQRALYATFYALILRWRWGAITRSGEWMSDGRFRVSFALPPGSEALVAAFRGLLRGLPRLFGDDDAVVDMDVSDSLTVFWVTPPVPSRSLTVRAFERLRALLQPRAMLDQLLYQQEQLLASYEQLRTANEQLERQSEELSASRARSAAVVENTTNLILVCDEKGRISFANHSARQLLGAAPPRRWPLRILSLVHRDDRERAERSFRAAFVAERLQRTEFRLVPPDGGEPIWMEASGQRFLASRDRYCVLVVAHDISERKRAEQLRRQDSQRLEKEVQRRTGALERANQELRELSGRLINAERMGAAQELAGSVAHAINNPLAALLGNVDMMLESQDQPDDRLLRIQRLGRRIREVVGRTLQLSREGTLNFTLEDPEALLRDAHDEILPRSRARGVRLELKVERPLPRAFADRTMLRAALVAVAENAVDASPDNATVVLQASAVDGLRLVEFRIEDEGPGIPAAIRERIFEPFFTTKTSGTGLGLAIARGIVLGHEGRIQFHDRPGGGTIALVHIPLQVTRGDHRAPDPGLSLE